MPITSQPYTYCAKCNKQCLASFYTTEFQATHTKYYPVAGFNGSLTI